MKACCSKVKFGDKRVAYCPECGTRHNKESKGKSAFDYAGHKGQTIFKRYKSGTLYFKLNNYNGVGQEFLTYMEFKPDSGTGSVDTDGGSMGFKTRVISMSRKMSGRGKGKKKGLDAVSFNHTFFNPKNDKYGGTTDIHLSDEDIFDTTDERFDKIVRGIQPAFFRPVSKEEFYEFERRIMDLTNRIAELAVFEGEMK